MEGEALDEELIRSFSGQSFVDEGWMPLRRLDAVTVLAAVAVAPSPELTAHAERLLAARVEWVATETWAMRRTLLRVFSHAVAHDAANQLYEREPMLSARRVVTRSQLVVLLVAVAVLIGCLALWPRATLLVVIGGSSLAFLFAILFKYVLSMVGARYDHVERVGRRQIEQLRDEDLPVYTVLVPVFREANIVAQLIGNLGGLDYPAHKLEVLILTEEEDDETRAAVAASDPPPNFHVVVVPRGYPQTKPRACNVGLFVASGELLVIYDAEDTPEPDQLKKAVVAFRNGSRSLVCLQAALSFFNDEENALTRMFTLEYGFWFYYMLPGLEATRLPIPLGGTSNHFRTQMLRELGGWDPYNVTEDADLGIRASARGYRVGVIDSTTMEEANTSIPNFVRQRSRWIKGYMQTTLVHARRPRALIRQIGVVPFLGFVLLIAGTPVTFLAVLPSYVLVAASPFIPGELVETVVPTWAAWIMLFNFLIGNAIMVYVNMLGPFSQKRLRLVLWALLNPAYWILHSIAAYKALWQLITKPHYWEKTDHGLTAQQN